MSERATFWQILRQVLIVLWIPFGFVMPLTFGIWMEADLGWSMAAITAGMFLVGATLRWALQGSRFGGRRFEPFGLPRLPYWRMCRFWFQPVYLPAAIAAVALTWPVSGIGDAARLLGVVTLAYFVAMIIVTVDANARRVRRRSKSLPERTHG